ncbi:hypothetical protein EVAR_22057_1 [Eumeta japonica]|uniref:Uncharacterized protein n=1 Tax=Eumeta variegata TaxID=151549 RepID=A0A4C1USM6_EUMVA|nr:hypothetical protein EVAR_22057_1 [Eumeta japonica]
MEIGGTGSERDEKSSDEPPIKRKSERKERESPGTNHQLPKRKKEGRSSFHDKSKLHHPGKSNRGKNGVGVTANGNDEPRHSNKTTKTGQIKE